MNLSGFVDLHTHSVCSDGTLTPKELIEHALSISLSAVALTDHDTIEGVNEAVKAGKNRNIHVIPGVEISAEYKNGTMHIVGLFLQKNLDGLQKSLARLQQAREERNPMIIKRLVDLGIPITFEKVKEISGQGQIGRPHIAKALMDIGVVKDFDDAFVRYLGKDKPAYVDKFRFSPVNAINMVKDAGGVAILAHPNTLYLEDDKLEKKLIELKDSGLEGIETIYCNYSKAMINIYARLAKKIDLAQSGGSDFHGANKEDSELGIGNGNMRVPVSFLVELEKRAAKM